MSSVPAEPEPEPEPWVPTHVQVTVLRARGLRGKGKNGTSDVYTIIQVGKEKYSTCVAEKSTAPEWREECCFELPPSPPQDPGRGVRPPGSYDLVLTVMHRALIGLDVFLGQAVIPLDKALRDNVCMKNEWFRLNSKTGKKEKERGEIQATVQFTRNNLTASMYDLAMKDKSHSTFSKLKERMRGKKRSVDEDSSSAVLPGGGGGLSHMRSRLPSDGGGEEEYEDDEGGEGRRNKMRNFFLRGKLRKSSETRSSTSLGSESSESSRGGSLSPTAGISVVVSDLSNSPSNSSNLTADDTPEHTVDTSPKLSPNRSEFDEEFGEISIAVPPPTVCVNGGHAYSVRPPDPGSGTPAASLGLNLLQKPLPFSVSLQNLFPRPQELHKGPVGDGRRWSFDKPGDEEKAAIAAALERSGPMVGDEEPPSPASSGAETESRGEKQRRNLFSHGRSESAGRGLTQSGDGSEQAPAPAQEKHKGWFPSKDSHSKPSPVVSPKLEPSTESHPVLLPTAHLPPWGPSSPLHPDTMGSPLHHSNPFFGPSQTTPPPMSPSNPFFPSLQHNPFYGNMLTDRILKPPPPPLPYLSSSRPPIAQLFPQAGNPNASLFHHRPAAEDSMHNTDPRGEALAKLKQRPLPPVATLEEKSHPTLSKRTSNPFICPVAGETDVEWDDSFEAFAAGRLQSPEDWTSECKPWQNSMSGPPLEPHGKHEEGLPQTIDVSSSTSVNASRHPSNSGVTLDADSRPFPEEDEIPCQISITLAESLAPFPQFDNFPAHGHHEGDSDLFTACESVSTETNFTNHSTDTLTSTNYFDHVHYPPSPIIALNNNSSNPSSSGVGSAAEEDLPSSASPYSTSEKFSASSADEADSINSCVLGVFANSSERVLAKLLTDSVDKVITWSDNVAQGISFQLCSNEDEKVPPVSSGGQVQLLLPAPLPPLTTEELETGDACCKSPSPPPVLWSDLQANTSVPEQSSPHSEAPVSIQPNREGGHCELRESTGNFDRMENGYIPSNYNTEPIIAQTMCDESATARPLFNMTPSPDDQQSFDNDSSINLAVCQNSPERACLPSLDSIQMSATPEQTFEDTLLNTNTSLYLSADSQYYQTCLSHFSSEEAAGKWPAERLRSAKSYDEAEEYQSADDTMNTSASVLNNSPVAPRPSEVGLDQTERVQLFQSEAMSLSEDWAAPQGPSFTVGDLGLLSNALTDSYIDCNHDNVKRGVEECVPSDDMLSAHPRTLGSALQRSYSEGAMCSPFEDLLPPSFGSDPVVTQLSGSGNPPCSVLPPFLPPAPSLPAERSFPLALCPLPPCSAARSYPAPAPPATPAALCPAALATGAPHAGLPSETQQQKEEEEEEAAEQQNSPHPVKPLTAALLAEERRTEGRSVLASGLEKLKSSIHPGRSSQLSESEPQRRKSLTEGAGSYYHLTHSELVELLVQREAEYARQKAESERKGVLLAKREVELRKLKPQVRDLEDYIDTLLVRIMEQTPTLLQVRSKLK